MSEDLCIHDLAPATCATCLHGPAKPVAETAECRTCHADIIWVVTEKGAKMPLDVEATGDGKFIKLRIEANGDKIVHAIKKGEAVYQPRYHSHFATCPDRDQHRRSR